MCQVLINGRPAPIYFVSSGQISVIVPYATELTIAGIQVVNNGTTLQPGDDVRRRDDTGRLHQARGWYWSRAVLHADFTLVTKDKPALPGETVQVYLTGLGDVTPANPDGQPDP
jgi:uncharacterized protein (TIGR03437 family)